MISFFVILAFLNFIDDRKCQNLFIIDEKANNGQYDKRVRPYSGGKYKQATLLASFFSSKKCLYEMILNDV